MKIDKYRIFARLLEYPTEELMDFVKNLEFSEMSFIKFKEQVKQLNLNKLEEIYTQTFDLQAICYPYAGYQLFGEDYRRGDFMTKLKEEYRAKGFVPPEGELPDHIGVILRYLSHNPSDTVLIEECLLPVFEKFLRTFKENTDNPYYFLLKGIFEAIKSENRGQTTEEGKNKYKENFILITGGINYE